MTEINPHPQRAADLVGGQAALARLLSTPATDKEAADTITSQGVGHWCRTGKVPAERVLKVEEVTGVSRHDLRPDLYPVEFRVPHPVMHGAAAATTKGRDRLMQRKLGGAR